MEAHNCYPVLLDDIIKDIKGELENGKITSIKKQKFDWDPDIRMATCEIDMKDDGVFVGTAFCHEDDMDMCSELTGQTIAYFRASIAYYKFLKNNRIKPGLKALNQAYYSMNRSKKFNPDAYETKLLLSQINIYKADPRRN